MTPVTHRGQLGFQSGVQSSDYMVRFLDTGVVPHHGSRGRNLRFRTTNARWVTARVVRHPGIQPHYIRLRAESDLAVAFEEVVRPG